MEVLVLQVTHGHPSILCLLHEAIVGFLVKAKRFTHSFHEDVDFLKREPADDNSCIRKHVSCGALHLGSGSGHDALAILA